MEIERFNALLEDSKVAKIFSGFGGGVFKDEENGIAFTFLFAHSSSFNQTLPHGKRLHVDVFPLKNLTEAVVAFEMSNKLLILANADFKNYALAYSVTVDKENKTVRIVLEDEPKIGMTLVTEEEKMGIQIPLPE